MSKEGDTIIVAEWMLLAVLAAGGYYDLRYHRIPNWWILGGMAAGILLELLFGGAALSVGGMAAVAAGFLARMAVAAAVFFIFFLCRMIGAGDIKLIALICGYLGIWRGILAVGCGFLAGAALSLALLLHRGSLKSRLSYFLAYIRRVYRTKEITAYYDPGRDGREGVIPLGACLFIGTLAYIILK